MALTGRRLTLDEFLELPEENPGLEYLNGKVVRKESPKAYHGSTQYAFAEKVNLFARPRRLARAFPETRSTFSGWSPVPDVGVYTWENLPRRADRKILTDFQTPWDIAVEIVSPD
jgi:Uma2 family endonuclease